VNGAGVNPKTQADLHVKKKKEKEGMGIN